MGDFFDSGFPHVFAWFAGSLILGAVLVYGVMRSGRLKGQERQQLDRNTEVRQKTEDPQKR
jgi:hypothetical protein